MSSVEQRLASLEKDVAVLQKDVAVLQKDVATLQKDVAALQKDVATLQKDVAVIKKQLEYMPTKDDLTREINLAVERVREGVDKKWRQHVSWGLIAAAGILSAIIQILL